MTTYKVSTNSDNIRLDVQKVEQKLSIEKLEYSVTLARTGGQGAAGGYEIGGLPVVTQDIETGDLLTVANAQWVNVKRTNITDGGNF